MKYIITGSLGHISAPIVEQLVKGNHDVVVISSNADRKDAIEKLGAKAAIGSLEDLAFLQKTFSGADSVYLMIPPNMQASDFLAYQRNVADNYIEAIKNTGVKYVVVLSSIGAHMRKGAGPIDGLAYLEERLTEIKGINVLNLRPSYFFYNLFAMSGMIKQANMMGSNFGGNHEKLILTDTKDIADIAAKHLLNLDFSGHSVEYISSDERDTDEIAKVLSSAVGKDAPWITFTDEQMLQGMLQMGLPDQMAGLYVQMGKSIREGKIQEEYWRTNNPAKGKFKLEDFAKQFAAVYNS